MSELRKSTGVSLRERMIVLLIELRIAIVLADTEDKRLDVAHRIDYEARELAREAMGSEAKP